MALIKNSPGVQQPDKEFMCPYDDCLKAFTSTSHLNRHEAVHINKTYKCEECSTTFTCQFSLKRHVDNKHLKKKPKMYKCSYCEESFNKKTWLNRHLYRHTGVKPYVCTFENCEARFPSPSKLKRHLKIHEGYTCPKENCNEKFAKFTEVRKHLKIVHPKGEPCDNHKTLTETFFALTESVFKCPECEQEFSRLNNLKSHSVIHNSDRHVFLCPKERCHRFYSKKNNLMDHIKHYHEKRPFNCTIGQCSRAFKSQEDLDDHISRHTPSGKLKKRRKKKNKSKPSFAEKLAGLAPKKWQIDVLEGTSKSTDAKPSLVNSSDLSSTEDHSETELENITKAQDELSSLDENCNELPSSANDGGDNDANLHLNHDDVDDDCSIQNDDDVNDDCCIQNDDIQTLLKIIENRKNFDSSDVNQKTKCISLEA